MSSDQEWLVEHSIRILNRYDPMAISPGSSEGPPWDEYEPEAADLVALLQSGGAVSAGQVQDVWLNWFRVPVGGESVAAAIARELTDLAGPASAVPGGGEGGPRG